MKDNLIKYIIKVGVGDKYIKLTNTVGQCWYFPYKYTKSYMSLFQPSSMKGTIAALLLPYIKHYKWLLPLFRAEIVRLQVDRDFVSVLEQNFNQKNITCAIFCGSPGKHQKPTILVASQSRCIGYCKVSDNIDVIEIFKKEKQTLDSLHLSGVEDIPYIHYCSPWIKYPSLWLFCQSTQRNGKEKVAKIEDKEVRNFVFQMYEKTRVEAVLDDTDFGKSLIDLDLLVGLLEDKELIDVVRMNIVEVREKLADKSCIYSAFHGDLTPWNSFIIDNHLYVFDFEYFKSTYPPFADYFHFFTQSMIYDFYATAEQIWIKYQDLKQSIFKEMDNCDFLYRCYLLAIIEFYLSRDNGILNSRLRESFKIWIYLLMKLKNGGGYLVGSYLGLKGKVLYWMREFR